MTQTTDEKLDRLLIMVTGLLANTMNKFSPIQMGEELTKQYTDTLKLLFEVDRDRSN